MRRIRNIRLLLMGFGMVALMCVLPGCSREEEVIFFTEEEFSVQQEGMLEEGTISEEMAKVGSISETGAGENNTTVGKIMVYICGAVKTPGVVELSEGSRMNDAVLAAGGFTEDASVTSINLAAKLEDEEMIRVLTMEEAETQKDAPAADLTTGENSLININTADIFKLCSLPGIGESKARDIITYREKNGAFQKKEDIMQVEGIKENLFQKICDLISVK